MPEYSVLHYITDDVVVRHLVVHAHISKAEAFPVQVPTGKTPHWRWLAMLHTNIVLDCRQHFISILHASEPGVWRARQGLLMAAPPKAAHQPLTFGTSAAGVPRTYRIVPVKRRVVPAFLARSASGCGRLLNSVMVLVGDRVRLYKTGQYR